MAWKKAQRRVSCSTARCGLLTLNPNDDILNNNTGVIQPTLASPPQKCHCFPLCPCSKNLLLLKDTPAHSSVLSVL